MHTLFNIYPDQSRQRLEQTHLLILALLNFDHTVHIVFHKGSEQFIKENADLSKKWQALPLYGAHDFWFFNGQHDNLNDQQYRRIKQRADFIS
ncbi:MAG: hypothetical protein DWP95_06575 [Proteobacteria bacterium]|nr:MAG: hypothetical protein DWP95_06575 [Pseudomonadota bacterium]